MHGFGCCELVESVWQTMSKYGFVNTKWIEFWIVSEIPNMFQHDFKFFSKLATLTCEWFAFGDDLKIA